MLNEEKLMSPLQVIDVVSRSKTLAVEDIRDYLTSILKNESKVIEEENAQPHTERNFFGHFHCRNTVEPVQSAKLDQNDLILCRAQSTRFTAAITAGEKKYRQTRL